MVLELSVADRHAVWNLWQAPTGKLQHRSLGYQNKALPFSADNYIPPLFFKYFIYLILDKNKYGRWRGRETCMWERNLDQSPLAWAQTGDQACTQACLLTRHQWPFTLQDDSQPTETCWAGLSEKELLACYWALVATQFNYEPPSYHVTWAAHHELGVIWHMKLDSWMRTAKHHCQMGVVLA